MKVRHKAVVSALACLAMILPGFTCSKGSSVASDANLDVDRWAEDSGWRSVAQSEQALAQLRKMLGARYEALPAVYHARVMYVLGRQYFWEGNLKDAGKALSAFTILKNSPNEGDVVFAAYVDGLAGDANAVEVILGGMKTEDWALLRESLKAWAKGDYEIVIKMSEQEANVVARDGPRSVAAIWASLVLARAYEKCGAFGKAYDVFESGVIRDLMLSKSRPDLSVDVRLHAVIVGADISEKAGKRDEALLLAKAATQRMGDVVFNSWASEKGRMERMVARLSEYVATSSSATSAPPVRSQGPSIP